MHQPLLPACPSQQFVRALLPCLPSYTNISSGQTLLSLPRGHDVNILKVVQVSVALSKLGGKVDQMAAEKQVVLRRYGERVAHESSRVHNESTGH